MRGMLGLSMSPLTNVVRLGGTQATLGEIRSAPEFDGSQWGELRPDIDIGASQPFSLTWVLYSDNFINKGFADLVEYEAHSLPRSRVNINANGEFVFQLGSQYRNAGEVVTSKNLNEKLCVFSISRDDSDSVNVSVNSDVVLTTNISDAIRLDRLLLFGGTKFSGIPFGFLSTGNESIKRTIRFDNENSDNQFNYSSEIGAELHPDPKFLDESKWQIPSPYEWNIANGKAAISESSISQTATIAGSNQVPLQIYNSYMIEVVIDNLSGSLKLEIYDSSGNTYNLNNGVNRIVHTAAITGFSDFGLKAAEGCTAEVSGISIREWSGCVLQNMIHGNGGNWIGLRKLPDNSRWVSLHNYNDDFELTSDWSRISEGVYYLAESDGSISQLQLSNMRGRYSIDYNVSDLISYAKQYSNTAPTYIVIMAITENGDYSYDFKPLLDNTAFGRQNAGMMTQMRLAIKSLHRIFEIAQ